MEETTTRRRYVMRHRAAAVAETRDRIVRGAIAAAYERLTLELTLQDVADRAGVTVQTVLRHFGNRDGLMDAALATASADVDTERRVPPGDVEAAVLAVVAHYERVGDFAVALLAEAQRSDRARAFAEPGKAFHRRWVEESFGPQLEACAGEGVDELTDLLAVATDVYAWVLLRRDRGLTREATAARMRALVEAVLAGGCAEGARNGGDARGGAVGAVVGEGDGSGR